MSSPCRPSMFATRSLSIARNRVVAGSWGAAASLMRSTQAAGHVQCHQDVIDVAVTDKELADEPAFDAVAVCKIERLGSCVGPQDTEGDPAGSTFDRLSGARTQC